MTRTGVGSPQPKWLMFAGTPSGSQVFAVPPGRAAGWAAVDDADGLVAETLVEAAREKVVGEELDERATAPPGLVFRALHERATQVRAP